MLQKLGLPATHCIRNYFQGMLKGKMGIHGWKSQKPCPILYAMDASRNLENSEAGNEVTFMDNWFLSDGGC